MVTVKQNLILIALIVTTTAAIAQSKPMVELFLVDKVAYADTLGQKNGNYFFCSSKDLPQNSFFSDNEILGYGSYKDTSKSHNQNLLYFLEISKSGKEKLKRLNDIPLCCGRRFVIAVNRQPIYGGYFWNYLSSFGSSWVTIPAFASQRLPIERGLPFAYFTKKHSDPRGNKILIEALRKTGRLLVK